MLVVRQTFFVLALLGAFTCPRALADTTTSEPLVAVEVRGGDGIAIGAGRGPMIIRPSRFTLGVLAEIAVVKDPWITAFAEVLLEALNTASMGLRAGARIYFHGTGFRATAGIASIVVPSTLGGASIALGYCKRVQKKIRVCADADAIIYFLGNDLPAHRIAAQIQLQVGVSFDAL